jgi:hypothetical protein
LTIVGHVAVAAASRAGDRYGRRMEQRDQRKEPRARGGVPTGDKDEAARLNRNYADLLQELRVTQAGVQILFAFLLTLPFQARFETVTGFERAVYVATLLAAMLAAATLIAPVAYHRTMFRQGRKRQLVRSAHRLASVGLVFLAVAMVGAVLLVTEVVLGVGWGAGISIAAGACFVLLWWLLPLRRKGEQG